MIIAKRIRGILLMVVGISFFASCSSLEQDKQQLYEHALQYIEKNERESAILELRSAIQLDARFGKARYQLGLLYLQEGETRKAIEELVRAADLLPDNLDAHYKVASFNLLAGRKEDCRRYLDHIFARDPGYTRALALLARLELSEKNFDKALKALEATGEELNTSDELQVEKGRIHVGQQRWDEAETAYKRAIALDGADISHYSSLLFLHELRKEDKKSKKLLTEIAERFPESSKTHLLLAGYFKKNGEPDKAEQELRSVVDLEPQNPGYRLQLADYLQQRGKIDQAEATLVEARGYLDKNPDIAAALAGFYFDSNKLVEAKKLHEQLRAESPEHTGTALLQARFLLKEGRNQDAVAILQELTHDFPHWPEPLFHLGEAHFKMGQVDFAQQAVASAIQKKPNASAYHWLMAQLYIVRNSYEDARNEAAAALRLNPRNPRAALLLSRALIGTREFDQAIALLTDMRKQMPGNAEVLDNLATACLQAGDHRQGGQYLHELLEIDPGHMPAITRLLGLQYKNDPAGAESFLHRQMKKAPDDSRLYFLLGGLLEKQKKVGEALAAYEKALELNPDNVDSMLAAARLLTASGKNKEAMARFLEVIENHPKSITGHMGIAAILEGQGEPGRAIEQYKKILEIQEDFAPAANNIAWLLASEPGGDLGNALMLAMKAKQLLPNDPKIADTLGWVHYHRGSYPLAIAQFEFALQQRPDNPLVAYHLALAQSGAMQREAALQTLHTLLARKVDFAERERAEALLGELTAR